MKTDIVDRKSKEKYIEKSPKSATVLYKTLIGGIVLAFVTRKTVSKAASIYMNSKLSTRKINKFIRRNNINMDDYPSDADSYDYIKFPIESTKEWQKAQK